jgi:CheY-like chemotaxis protein
MRRLLVIEDDRGSRKAINELVGSEDVEIIGVGTGEDALAALAESAFDCIILDLGLPGMDGFQFLERAGRDGRFTLPPVVVYSGKELSPEDDMRLREYTDSIVIKGARSPERLVDEVTLFLHSVHENLPPEQKRMLAVAHGGDEALAGKAVLVVDDDMRNTFALAKALRAHGLEVLMAKDGLKALSQLEEHHNIDLVLMDIMMPGMDGYETITRIRGQTRFRKLPIIAVTAKAMRGDKEKCLEAGANDYLSKPIDMDKLLSMMRVWL